MGHRSIRRQGEDAITSVSGPVAEWLAGSPDWKALISHFDLGLGFSFVVLLVPSEPVARTCSEALEAHLAAAGKTLFQVPVSMPEDLAQLPGTLLVEDLKVSAETGGIWVELVVSRDLEAYRRWRDAWREAVLKLNQFRNGLMRRFSVPVIFVGAPWLKEVVRNAAPDLWSIRSLVAVIEPEFPRVDPEDFRIEPDRYTRATPDPEFALRKIAELSDRPESDPMRARLLLRAGEGFFEQRDWTRSAEYLQRILRIEEKSIVEPDVYAAACLYLGRLEEESRRFAEAEKFYCRSLAAAETDGLIDILPSIYQHLGNIKLEQREFESAREKYEKSLALDERLGNRVGVAATYHQLGRLAEEQLDPETARSWYLRSLSIQEKLGNLSAAAATYHQLGRLAEEQLDFETAREWYLKSLAIWGKDGQFHNAAVTLRQLGVIALKEENSREGARFLTRSTALFSQAHDPQGAERNEQIWRDAGLGDFPAEVNGAPKV